MRKFASRIGATVLALALGVVPALAGDAPLADFSSRLLGPDTLQSGVSGTYTLTVFNDLYISPVEIIIIFMGQADQTGQIVAPGWDCEVREDTGINAAIRCVMAAMDGADEGYDIVFQSRGLDAGTGRISAVINPTSTANEIDHENNNSYITVTVR